MFSFHGFWGVFFWRIGWFLGFSLLPISFSTRDLARGVGERCIASGLCAFCFLLLLGWVLVFFVLRWLVSLFWLGWVRILCYFSHITLRYFFFLLGDMFVFRVLFAFGFGHRFSCWSFVSVWEYFLSGSVRSCSEYVVRVLRRGDGGPHCGLFCFFSCVSLRICLGKWCSVWDFDFSVSYTRHLRGILFLANTLLIGGRSFFLLFFSPFLLASKNLPFKHFLFTGIY